MKIFLLVITQLILVSASAQTPIIGSGVYHWADFPVKKDNHREGRKILQGSNTEFEFFEVHATTQLKGATAKPPHVQKDIEELIIIKEGIMKCSIGDKKAILGPGSVLLIPPTEAQTFENAGDGPLTYYVFMFRSKKKMDVERSTKAGGALLLNYDSLAYTENSGKGTRKYFDRPTAMCERYEMHITALKEKGPSHAPHQHVETEIILMIEGNTEIVIDGKTYQAGPGDFFIAASGTMHGISNSDNKPCSYFAFKWK